MINDLFIPKQVLKALRVSSAEKVARVLDDTSDSETSEYERAVYRRWGAGSLVPVNRKLKSTIFSSEQFQQFEGESASEMAHDISSSESSSSDSDTAGSPRVPSERERRQEEEEHSRGSSSEPPESPNLSTIPRRLSTSGRAADSPAPAGFQNSTLLEGPRAKKLGQKSIKDYGELSKTRENGEHDEIASIVRKGGRLGCEGEFWFKPFEEYSLIEAKGTQDSHSHLEKLLNHSPEELEVFLVQCPRDFDPETLRSLTLKDIIGDGASWKKLQLPRSNTQYETYFDSNRAGETLNLVRLNPGGRSSSHRLGTYTSKGSVIIVQDVDTNPPGTEEPSTNFEENRKKTKRKKSEEIPNGGSPLYAPLPKRQQREDSSCDLMSADLNESLADESRPHKKKKIKHVKETVNDTLEPLPIQAKRKRESSGCDLRYAELNEILVDESRPHAKKKKKHKKEMHDNELETPRKQVPEEEESTPVKKKKKKKKKHDEEEMREEIVPKVEEETPSEEPPEQEVVLNKSKKKKKKKQKDAELEAWS